jgi:hypothetical protein
MPMAAQKARISFNRSFMMEIGLWEYSHLVNGIVTTRQNPNLGQNPIMIGEMVREALRGAVLKLGRRPGLKGAADAAGISHDVARGIVEGRSGKIDLDAAIKLGAAIGVDVPDLISGAPGRPTIAIAGHVGAGARVPLVDAFEKGDGPQVECPPGLGPHGIVAVEVEGDSMEPVYSNGDLLFYTRHALGVPDEALGHRCVCEDESGLAWVKQVKPGRDPGTFDLISLNRGVDPMWGVRLKWAARVRLHWPAELAVRAG